MVLGSHVIFGTYGFWLPNDPRGSWSEFIGAWELFRYGPVTKTTARRSVAAVEHDVRSRLAAKDALKYPAVKFTGRQALAVGRGFAEFSRSAGLEVWACAILPDHVHLVVERFRYDVEKLVIQLKGAATRQLEQESLHPMERFRKNDRLPKAFARGEWKVFLDEPDDIMRSIGYVEQNPVKDGPPTPVLEFRPSLSPITASPFSRDPVGEHAALAPPERSPGGSRLNKYS